MKIKRSVVLFAIVALFFGVSACSVDRDSSRHERNIRLNVVASLFPVYDFARNIGGGDIDVTLLLPPGTEPHSFEPSPVDIMRLKKADIFIYTNRVMEPWAEDIVMGLENSRLKSIDAGLGIETIKVPQRALPDKKQAHNEHAHYSVDPHIWLDFGNAAKMVDNIAAVFIEKDPANTESYQRNADVYKARLAALDKKFAHELSLCRKRVFIDGGHYTFGYLARRYGLEYFAAYRMAPDSEPSAKGIADITRMIKKHGLEHIYYEELLSPRIAETIAKETGARLLKLHGAHNISLNEMASGTGFIDLMEQNLENLKEGLQCR